MVWRTEGFKNVLSVLQSPVVKREDKFIAGDGSAGYDLICLDVDHVRAVESYIFVPDMQAQVTSRID